MNPSSNVKPGKPPAKPSSLGQVMNMIIDDTLDTKILRPILISAGIGAALGIPASMLLSQKKKDKDKDLIRMYRAIESPATSEDEAIREYLSKKSAMELMDPLAYALAASVPVVAGTSVARKHARKKALEKKRDEVAQLRDAVNRAYREDMMEAYGVSGDAELSKLVKELSQEAMKKSSAELPVSVPAMLALAGSTGLGTFLLAKGVSDRTNPAKMQEKRYKELFERIKRGQLGATTVSSIPFTDEELIALEMAKTKGKKRVPKAPEPVTVKEEVPVEQLANLDDEDVASILKEL